jgi:fatty acid desaturase
MGMPKDDLYVELRERVVGQGLLDRQPIYYTHKIATALILLGASIAIFVIFDSFLIRLLDAVFMAFAFGQIGYVGHDAGHRGIFKSNKGNEAVGLAVNFLLSLCRSWWITRHNQHHSTPNDLELDPHTEIPFMAFSQEQASTKKGILRFFVKYQAFYFWSLMLLEGIGIRVAGAQFIISERKSVKYPVIEPVLMIAHFVAYFGLLFLFLSPWQVLIFTAVHQGLFGLYYGLAFAPNHKGMLIVDKNNPLSFVETQVLTTRNVKPNMLVNLFYGGLNYQIEHHLFPNMPRNNFGKAQKIIKQFCAEKGISYCEVGVWESYKQIFCSIHKASSQLRGSPGAVA